MATEPLSILSNGKRHSFQVEIAETSEQRAQGLMFRRALAPGTGMLFDFKRQGEVTMWMANTYIPLDMLFIRPNGVIHRIERDTVPFSTATISSKGPVLAVLELPAGTTRRLGIGPGDRAEHRIFKPSRAD